MNKNDVKILKKQFDTVNSDDENDQYSENEKEDSTDENDDSSQESSSNVYGFDE